MFNTKRQSLTSIAILCSVLGCKARNQSTAKTVPADQAKSLDQDFKAIENCTLAATTKVKKQRGNHKDVLFGIADAAAENFDQAVEWKPPVTGDKLELRHFYLSFTEDQGEEKPCRDTLESIVERNDIYAINLTGVNAFSPVSNLAATIQSYAILPRIPDAPWISVTMLLQPLVDEAFVKAPFAKRDNAESWKPSRERSEEKVLMESLAQEIFVRHGRVGRMSVTEVNKIELAQLSVARQYIMLRRGWLLKGEPANPIDLISGSTIDGESKWVLTSGSHVLNRETNENSVTIEDGSTIKAIVAKSVDVVRYIDRDDDSVDFYFEPDTASLKYVVYRN